MHRKLTTFQTFSCLLLLLSYPGGVASANGFLRFGPRIGSQASFPGSSTDPRFPGANGWIKVEGFEQNLRPLLNKRPSAGTQTEPIRSLGPIRVTKEPDVVSPHLLEACVSGSGFEFVQWVLPNPVTAESSDSPFCEIRFQRVLLDRMEWVADGETPPMEHIFLRFVEFQWTVHPRDHSDPAGSVTMHTSPNLPSVLGPLPGIVLQPSSLSVALVGRPFQISFSATGATAPYLYLLDGGELPAGLSLSPDGLLSGIPTQAGEFTFGVRGGDEFGAFDRRSYTLRVAPKGRIRVSHLTPGDAGSRLQLEGRPDSLVQIESAQALTGPWLRLGAVRVVPSTGVLDLPLEVASSPARFFRATEVSGECPELPEGIIHWWRGETGRDEIGGAPLVRLGEPVGMLGEVGTAFAFDGLNDRLDLGASRLGLPDERGGWTLAVWLNREDSLDTSSALLLDDGYAVKLEQYGEPARRIGLTWFGHWDARFFYSAPEGIPVHLALTDTPTGTVLFVNGERHEQIPYRIPLPLRWMGGGAGDRLRGSVDELLIFNRALADEEVGELFNRLAELGNCPVVR